MTNITKYTRTLFGPGNDLVVFNPGTVVSAQWYSLADYILAFEDTYTGEFKFSEHFFLLRMPRELFPLQSMQLLRRRLNSQIFCIK